MGAHSFRARSFWSRFAFSVGCLFGISPCPDRDDFLGFLCDMPVIVFLNILWRSIIKKYFLSAPVLLQLASYVPSAVAPGRDPFFLHPGLQKAFPLPLAPCDLPLCRGAFPERTTSVACRGVSTERKQLDAAPFFLLATVWSQEQELEQSHGIRIGLVAKMFHEADFTTSLKPAKDRSLLLRAAACQPPKPAQLLQKLGHWRQAHEEPALGNALAQALE